MNSKNDPLFADGYCYQKLKEAGYLVYTFDTNESAAVTVEVASEMTVDAFR